MRNKPFQQRVLSSRQIAIRTGIGLVSLLAFLFAFYTVYQSIAHQPRTGGTPAPLRSVLNTNERIFSSIFDSNKLIKEYPLSMAVSRVRVNGNEGLRSPLDTAQWNMKVVRSNGDTLTITLDALRKLPKKDVVFEFKCIEGWSQITHWAGVSFRSFMEAYHLDAEKTKAFIGLQTPDKGYYVGIDMASAMQPQTILCYEMNGQPLPLNQGYPLRLIIPVKYGIKHLKRIGTLFFSNTPPPDYWAERGYDYYAGH